MITSRDVTGGYGHPDHRMAHLVAVEAFRRSDIPSKLYFIARRRRDWDKLRERMQAAGVEVPAPPQRQLDPEVLRQMEAQEARITTTVDTTAVVARKRAALAAHASQLDQSWWSHFSDDSFAEVFGTETFIRAFDRTGAPIPEDDLLAGYPHRSVVT
jgi:LmbE family N-acetylglucosaminyl deacetylase